MFGETNKAMDILHHIIHIIALAAVGVGVIIEKDRRVRTWMVVCLIWIVASMT
jgi:hypothetical protein